MTEIERILAMQGRMKGWLARRIGVTPAGLWHMLHQTEYPDYRWVLRIADALGVKPGDIADGQGRWLRAREPVA